MEDKRTMSEKIAETIVAEQEAQAQTERATVAMAALMQSYKPTNSRAAAHRGQKEKSKAKRRAARKRR